MSNSSVDIGFLDCDYHYTLVATQIPCDDGFTSILYTRLEFLLYWDQTSATSHLTTVLGLIICNQILFEKSYILLFKLTSKHKPIVCALTNNNLNSGEKFEPGPGFEPQTSRSLAWRSTT